MADPWIGTALAVALLACACIGMFLAFLLAVLLLEPSADQGEAEEEKAEGVWTVRHGPCKRRFSGREGTS